MVSWHFVLRISRRKTAIRSAKTRSHLRKNSCLGHWIPIVYFDWCKELDIWCKLKSNQSIHVSKLFKLMFIWFVYSYCRNEVVLRWSKWWNIHGFSCTKILIGKVNKCGIFVVDIFARIVFLWYEMPYSLELIGFIFVFDKKIRCKWKRLECLKIKFNWIVSKCGMFL